MHCEDKIGCRPYRVNLCVEDEENDNMIVVALMGWGSVNVCPTYWEAEYAQPIAVIEHKPQLRDAVLRVAEKHILPVRHDGPEDAMKDFEGFEELTKEEERFRAR